MSNRKLTDATNELILYEEFMGCRHTFPMRSMTVAQLMQPVIELKEDDPELYEEFQYFKERYNSQYR